MKKSKNLPVLAQDDTTPMGQNPSRESEVVSEARGSAVTANDTMEAAEETLGGHPNYEETSDKNTKNESEREALRTVSHNQPRNQEAESQAMEVNSEKLSKTGAKNGGAERKDQEAGQLPRMRGEDPRTGIGRTSLGLFHAPGSRMALPQVSPTETSAISGGQSPSPKPKRRLERNAEHQKYFLRDGSQVGGCSTIAKLGDSPEGLIRWANQMGLKGIDSSKFRDKTADIGSISHFMMSCFLDKVEPDLREYDDRDIAKAELGYFKFLDFWDKERLIKVASEIQLVSELYRYGGTLDIVARDENGRLLICEGKSSKAVYWGHKCQLGGQEQLWNETHEEQISRRCILRIPPTDEGEFQVHWIPDEKAKKYINIFRAQAQLFNAMKENK